MPTSSFCRIRKSALQLPLSKFEPPVIRTFAPLGESFFDTSPHQHLGQIRSERVKLPRTFL